MHLGRECLVQIWGIIFYEQSLEEVKVPGVIRSGLEDFGADATIVDGIPFILV
jgi:hypothetical protein